jgi:S1-C subfamily serine protease
VIVEPELDPGGFHAGIEADLTDARGALVTGAQPAGDKELAGRAARQQLVKGRPVTDAESAAAAIVELGRGQQTAVGGWRRSSAGSPAGR